MFCTVTSRSDGACRHSRGTIAADLVLIGMAALLSTGCWLSREASNCETDSDCRMGSVCFDNRGIHVCVPQAYLSCVDAGGQPEACRSATADSGAEDGASSDTGDDMASDSGAGDSGGGDSVAGDSGVDDIVDDLSPGDLGNADDLDTAGDLQTRDTGDEAGSDAVQEPLAPPPPTGLSASDGTSVNFVHVEWTASPGATSYIVLRDGAEAARDVVGTAHDDLGAGRNPPSAVGFNFLASTDRRDEVRLTWEEPETASVHEYRVIAVDGSRQSLPSASDTGFRSVPPITHYEISIDEGPWTSLGLTETFDDTTADAAIFDPGTVTAGDGESLLHVALEVTGIVSIDGDGRAYRVRAVSDLGDGVSSASATGWRGAPSSGPLQWQRSRTNEDADYEDIPGATASTYLDVEAPLSGEPRYYRVMVGTNELSPTEVGSRFVYEFEGDVTVTEDWLYEDNVAGPVRVFRDVGADWVELPVPRGLTTGDAIWADVLFHRFIRFGFCDQCEPGTEPDDELLLAFSRFNNTSVSFVSDGTTVAPTTDLLFASNRAVFGNTALASRGSGPITIIEYESSWSLAGSLPIDGLSGGDQLGATLAIYGSLVLASAPGFGDDGALVIYRKDGAWALDEIVSRAVPAGGDAFGLHSATDGVRVVVGVPDDATLGTAAGAVYVFAYDLDQEEWVEEALLFASDGLAANRFGQDLAISGRQILVASPGNQSAYLFRFDDGSEWYEYDRLVRPDVTGYGGEVGLDGSWLTISNVVSYANF